MIYSDWQASRRAPTIPARAEGLVAAEDPIVPIPRSLALDTRKVDLGRRLFGDRRLSADGSVSCATCHNLSTGGVDRRVCSRGIGGREGGINAPTVFNAGFNFRQFWDGRAETLEAQVDGPLQNPAEMGGEWSQAIATISADADYRAAFAAVYPDGITADNVRNAIATFERSLVTPDSRFDRYLRGDAAALSKNELAGYRLFKQIGCTSCHQGMNIGGNMYQKLGIMEDYFVAERARRSEVDQGRFNITKRDEDRHFFKVPSLRNVAVTPPYLHDGSAKTLEDAVSVMARYQLGTELDKADIASIAAFLRTLTGEYEGRRLE
ncbi:MAG TPA: cytochrome-c peroxidase [Rhodocyclaceae bacterium]|nr:cytochrome-c peroxidase [Rhodocyclaceae bacterium]